MTTSAAIIIRLAITITASTLKINNNIILSKQQKMNNQKTVNNYLYSANLLYLVLSYFDLVTLLDKKAVCK